MSKSRDDEGFVMMDALVAVAILGLVGTGALGLTTTLLGAQDRQLDRSVALVMSELVARQYAEFGPDAAGVRPADEQFDYEVVVAGKPAKGSRLTPMAVVARDKGEGGAELLRLDFLATGAS